jgi:hypothetical protein
MGQVGSQLKSQIEIMTNKRRKISVGFMAEKFAAA